MYWKRSKTLQILIEGTKKKMRWQKWNEIESTNTVWNDHILVTIRIHIIPAIWLRKRLKANLKDKIQPTQLVTLIDNIPFLTFKNKVLSHKLWNNACAELLYNTQSINNKTLIYFSSKQRGFRDRVVWMSSFNRKQLMWSARRGNASKGLQQVPDFCKTHELFSPIEKLFLMVVMDKGAV